MRFPALLFAAALLPAFATTYDYVTFTGPSGADIIPSAINNSGQIAGRYNDAQGVWHGFRRDPGGAIITIDPPGSTGVSAATISNTGWMAGTYFTDSATTGDYPRQTHGFRFSPDGKSVMTIDVPGSNSSTTALVVNASGQVAGTFLDGNGLHGFLMSADGKSFTTIDALPGNPNTQLSTLNDAGVTAGYAYGASAERTAWVRTAAGTITGFQYPGSNFTSALGINAAGQVVGFYQLGSSAPRAFLRSADGATFTTIETAGALRSYAFAINAGGAAVGEFGNGFNLRSSDGTFTAVALAGGQTSGVSGANDKGQIVGSASMAGSDGTIHTYGFLAFPIAASTTPVIRTYQGVMGASGFGASTGTAPGSWIEIYGEGLAGTARSWQLSDFTGDTAPTQLDGVTVRVNGQAAYLSYVSPEQINALLPASLALGTASVTVTYNGVTSAPQAITVNAAEPAMLTVRGCLAPVLADGTLARTDCLSQYSDIPTRIAHPGDLLTLYGIGFGPVSPALPDGQIVRQLSALQSNVTLYWVYPPVLFGPPTQGGPQATDLAYGGLAMGYMGLYQFNTVIPSFIFAPGVTLQEPFSWTFNGAGGTSTNVFVEH